MHCRQTEWSTCSTVLVCKAWQNIWGVPRGSWKPIGYFLNNIIQSVSASSLRAHCSGILIYRLTVTIPCSSNFIKRHYEVHGLNSDDNEGCTLFHTPLLSQWLMLFIDYRSWVALPTWNRHPSWLCWSCCSFYFMLRERRCSMSIFSELKPVGTFQ